MPTSPPYPPAAWEHSRMSGLFVLYAGIWRVHHCCVADRRWCTDVRSEPLELDPCVTQRPTWPVEHDSCPAGSPSWVPCVQVVVWLTGGPSARERLRVAGDVAHRLH